MRVAGQWQDYELLDTDGGEKLERWGDILLIRPDPQIIWHTGRNGAWGKAQARYHRSAKGGGSWDALPREQWTISYKNLRFSIRPTGFKHTG